MIVCFYSASLISYLGPLVESNEARSPASTRLCIQFVCRFLPPPVFLSFLIVVELFIVVVVALLFVSFFLSFPFIVFLFFLSLAFRGTRHGIFVSLVWIGCVWWRSKCGCVSFRRRRHPHLLFRSVPSRTVNSVPHDYYSIYCLALRPCTDVHCPPYNPTLIRHDMYIEHVSWNIMEHCPYLNRNTIVESSIVCTLVGSHSRSHFRLYTRYERVQRGHHVRDWRRRFLHPGGRAGRFLRHHIDLYCFLHDGHPLSRLRSQGNPPHSFHFL